MTKKKEKNRIKPMALMDRDVSIILSVYENRFMRRDQIQRLYFPDTSLVACNVRLRKLSGNKLLDRLQRPASSVVAQAVYGLGKRGADVVAATLEIDRHKVRWSAASNNVEWLFMNHTLGISEFKVCLDLAMAGRSQEMLFYERGNKSHQRRISVPSSKKKYCVVAPDAYFGVQLAEGKYTFFVEIDLGTETLARFNEKILAYKEYWKTGRYQQDYGFKFFRVLTVTESQRRQANLIQSAARVGAKRMFLFTNFEAIHNNGILERIWLSPASLEPLSILD